MASTERFGYKWSRYTDILPEHGVQFRKWIVPLAPADFRGARVLDAGCGIGANAFWMLQWGAKEVVAFDVDPRTVAAARKNLAAFPNARVLARSIFDIDWKDEFDFALSIGVIHHLEDPARAVQKLAQSVRLGGQVLIWVYGYEGNGWIVRYVSPVRRLIASRMNIGLLHFLTYCVSIPFYLFVKFLPTRSTYFQQLKGFRFSHTHSIIFDQLLPAIAHYYRESEAKDLLRQADLTDVTAHHVNGISWAVIGRKRHIASH